MATPTRELAEIRDRLLREVERVLAATEGLSDEQLAWTPDAKSANSLLVLAAHTVGAAERHILVNVAGRPAGGTRDEEFASKARIGAIRQRWEGVKRGIAEVLDGLPQERLGDDLSERMSNWSVHGMLVHAVAHASEHAGQAELTRDLIRG